jgi:hypothetical protein
MTVRDSFDVTSVVVSVADRQRVRVLQRRSAVNLNGTRM